MSKKRPIGVFDSGLGGLTVVRHLRKMLPHEDIIYLGDLARVPYGIKSKKQIIDYSMMNARFLLKQKAKAIVIACNSSSSSAYLKLRQEFSVPVIDVIRPAVKDALKVQKKGKVGIIGTLATVRSGVYEKELKKRNKKIKVTSISCPLFVPLAEEGWLKKSVTHDTAFEYLTPLIRKKVDTVILGCTHYPLLAPAIQRVLTKQVKLIESGPGTAQSLYEKLKGFDLLETSGKGKLKVVLTDKGQRFTQIGSRFLGEKLTKAKIVSW